MADNPSDAGVGLHPGRLRPEGVKELRLALVCFGGTSLAVYMHGVAREVHALLRASHALESDQADPINPYVRALGRRSATERDHPAMRVVVDVISGASAGGIDAVYLAKAIAGNLSQRGLERFWFEHGDLRRLLWGDVAGRHFYRALRQMTKESRGGNTDSLVPADQSLDLFVTVTDLNGYRRQMQAIPGGEAVADHTHRHVLHFSHRLSGPAPIRQFEPKYDPMLAFAARATSGFPGVFPPVQLRGFLDAIVGKEARERDIGWIAQEFFAEYQAGADEETDPAGSWFIDGGIVDNFPFRPAIQAIDHKFADTEVERHLIYIEPDPEPGRSVIRRSERAAPHFLANGAVDGASDGPSAVTRRERPAPGRWRSLWAGLYGIPTHQPIVDQIAEVRARNERIERIRDLIEARMERIEGQLEKTVVAGYSDPLGMLIATEVDYSTIRRAVIDLHDRAWRELGLARPIYLRLRLLEIARFLESMISARLGYPAGSDHAEFVRRRLERALFTSCNPVPVFGRRRDDLLRVFDLPFRERRLAFLIARINRWYSDPQGVSRERLDAAKGLVSQRMTLIWDLPRLFCACPDFADNSVALKNLRQLFGPQAQQAEAEKTPQEFVEDHRDELVRLRHDLAGWLGAVLTDVEKKLWEDLLDVTDDWPAPRRSELLLACYTGFPLWDAMTFPVTELSGIRHLALVHMGRISPLDAHRLGSPPEGKLRGVAWRRFGGFLRRSYRENDFLWGRLDAVELLLRLIDPQVTDGRLAEAFDAVIQAELPSLSMGVRARLVEGYLRPRIEELRCSAG